MERAGGGAYLYRLEVGDEFELGDRGQVELRIGRYQLVQSRVQRLLEHQHLAVARVLHQPLNKVGHLERFRVTQRTPPTDSHLENFIHGLLSLLAVDGEGDLLVGVGLLQLPRYLSLPLLQHRHVERESLVDLSHRLFVLTR